MPKAPKLKHKGRKSKSSASEGALGAFSGAYPHSQMGGVLPGVVHPVCVWSGQAF